jgi:hypothetical protein
VARFRSSRKFPRELRQGEVLPAPSPHPDRARYPRRRMPISPGIMFLMYSLGRLVALVYIRRTLAGGKGGRTETDQGFYSHVRTTDACAQRFKDAERRPRRKREIGDISKTARPLQNLTPSPLNVVNVHCSVFKAQERGYAGCLAR